MLVTMKRLVFVKIILLGLALSLFRCNAEQPYEVLIKAPFEDLDTLCTNEWWNRAENPIINLNVNRDSVIAFGMYTVSNNTLKLSAQFFPLYPDESREVRFEILENNKWKEIAMAEINDIGWSALIRIEDWDHNKDISYRLRHGKNATFEGLVRKDPVDKNEISVAALSCNSNKDRGMRPNYVRNINFHDPDLVFFAGDQSYDHKEHTAAWLKFGLQFRDVFRNRPCISIPDDHDMGHGNLWGENGKKSMVPSADDGGYKFHPEYVKMVERCQTANLPDPFDPTPIEQGIGVYYTNLIIGGVDFAIIEDRKFKSGPNGKIPQQGPRPDHIRDPNYDPQSVDVPGLKLLGDRQLAFLEEWSKPNPDIKMKAVLSQTGFCGAAHVHGSIDNRLHADMDSNGWPQSGRNRALRLLKNANAIHIAGDQHLATVIRHGIEKFNDGPWAFVVPAIVNNYYSRWWWPENEKPGSNPPVGSELPWVGEYLDGFDNKITVHAYANPDSESYGAGYGLIRFNKEENSVKFECWPREVDVSDPQAKQFPNWPITVQL